MTAKLFQKQIQ